MSAEEFGVLLGVPSIVILHCEGLVDLILNCNRLAGL